MNICMDYYQSLVAEMQPEVNIRTLYRNESYQFTSL